MLVLDQDIKQNLFLSWISFSTDYNYTSFSYISPIYINPKLNKSLKKNDYNDIQHDVFTLDLY